MALDAAHSFKFYVKVGGSFVDLWARVVRGSVEINDVEGGEVDTLRLTLSDHDSSLSLTEWTECYLEADGTTRLFGGYIVKPKPRAAKGGQHLDYELTCESYLTLLARAQPVRKTYTSMTLAAIVADLFTEAGLTGFDAATYVDTGPTIDTFVADEERLPALLDRLTLLGQTGAPPGVPEESLLVWWMTHYLPQGYVPTGYLGSYGGESEITLVPWGWTIDASRNLIMGPAEDNPAPFGIADLASADWSTTFPPNKDVDIGRDASTIYNRVKVRGGMAVSSEVTDTFSGDGTQTLFQLSHAPVRDIVRITVGGELQAPWGVDWYDTFGGGMTCLVNYRAGTVRWPDALPPAAGSSNIVVTYRYDDYSACEVTVQDDASYALYGIWFDAPDYADGYITTVEQATTLGQALLAEYSSGVLEGSAEVGRLGLRAGQQMHVKLALFGLDDVFVLRRVVTRIDKAGTGVVAAVNFGGRSERLSSVVSSGGSGGRNSATSYFSPTTPTVDGELGVTRVRDRIELIDPLTDYVEP